MAIKHSAVSGRLITPADYAAAHVLDGQAGMLLSASGAEVNPATLSVAAVGSGASLLFTGAAGSSIASAITAIVTSGYSVAGIGGARYIYDAAITATTVLESGNAGTSFMAAINVPDAAARGFRIDDKQWPTFDMFGAVPGDYATGVSADCLPAWNRFQDWVAKYNRNVSIAGTGAGPMLFFPGAQYYFSGPIQIKRTVRLQGMGSGASGGEATWLRFPLNSAGIVVNRQNTLGDVQDLSAGAKGGDASIIDGFLIQGGIGAQTITEVLTTDLLFSGIRLRARAIIRNCVVRNFRGAGICISAAVGDGTDPFHGNANNWRVEDCRLDQNKTHGLFVSGGDANAGTALMVDCSRNGLFNIYDDSFLGNTYIACHTDAGNYISNFAGETRTGLVSHLGNRYYLKFGVTKATAQATTPGTNEAVWVYYQVGGVVENTPAWVNTGNYHAGGAYGGPSAFCLFLGCYYETGQAPPQLGQSAIIIGGFMGAGVSGDAIQLYGGLDGLYSQRSILQAKTYADASRIKAILGGKTNATHFDLLGVNSSTATAGFNPDLISGLVVEKSSGDIFYSNAGATGAATGSSSGPRFTSGNTGRTYGASLAEAGYALEAARLAIGSGNNARLMTMASAAPTTGAHGLGEIVWNDGTVTALATVDHWRCSVAGTPGTWIAK